MPSWPGFTRYADELGLELYPAQEEAIFEIALGNHVILNTPTGSGKSLVAAAAHFAALAAGKRSVYTAPIKALVSEKFFALCRDFGSDNVGMITGDASVNPDAPIICCTAEILANWSLRDGAATPVDVAIVDEFHYYGDPQRGWAWQVPLLELPQTQFLLMSATLGSVAFFAEDLTRRSGRETSVIKSVTRPVPLDFEYRTSTLHHSVTSLLESDKAPIYLVHFTQKEATEAAQNYLALDPLSKTEKAAVKEALAGFRFDSPIGKDLRRFITAGVGVHHAGLAPEVPAARREAGAGRPAQDHLRHRHTRCRRERADPFGAVHAAVQVRRHRRSAAVEPRVRPDRRPGRAQGVRRPRRRVGAGAGRTWWRTSGWRRSHARAAARRRSSRRSSPSVATPTGHRTRSTSWCQASPNRCGRTSG